MRLIDADKLYESLMTIETGREYEFCYPCMEVLQVIKKQPTVTLPEPKWIPCSERLPEKGKDVLVTRHYLGEKDNNKSCYYTEVAARYGDDDNPDWISFSDEYKMHPKNHIVIAWQELPEPYKGGK